MKLRSSTAAFFMLAIATTALGGEKHLPVGLQDKDGRGTLGVKITGTGTTPASVGRFLSALPADAAGRVRDGCRTVMGHQENYRPRILNFCRALPERNSITASNWSPPIEPRQRQ
jgi:hypothetical protein